MLVVTVIFIFLRSVTATIISSLTLPVTMVATFAVMYLFNYSLDNLSLMALTLSVGFVVDNTIVMLENIVRHMEMGKTPMRASYDGSKEVAFTIVAMTVSLVAIFIPVLFMGGLVGRLLEEFAVTIGVAIIVSGFVSISLTPMLCSRFLKPPHTQRHGWLYNLTERLFDGWLRAYDWSLRLSLKHRAVTLAASLLFVGGSAYLFLIVPKGFLPSEDQGRFKITRRRDSGHRLRRDAAPSDGGGRDRRRRIPTSSGSATTSAAAVAAVAAASSIRGAWAIDLKPRAERTRSVDQIIAELRPKLAQVPGVRVFMVNQPPINLGGQQGPRSTYQFTLQDTDTARALSCGADARGQDSRDSGHRGRQQRSASEQPADSARSGSRPHLVARLDGESSRDGALQRLRHAPGLADLRAEQSVSSHHGRGAGVPARSRGAVDVVRPFLNGQARAAEYRCAGDHRRGTAEREPHRPAPIGHDLVQPQAGFRARRCRHANSGDGCGDAAGDRVDAIPGHGAGVPGFAARPWPDSR